MSSNKATSDVLDDLWNVAKCHGIVKNFRRRLLYMDVTPSKHMSYYMDLFTNIQNTFVKNMLKGMHKTVYLHEEFCLQEFDGLCGELDLRIGDCIIDYKNTIGDEITAPWILQLLCYKSLFDLTHDTTIKTVAIFNPLRGWYCSIPVDEWTHQQELLTYLIDKRNTLLNTSTKH